ncbi:MEDS domain-containing protein [Bacillus infantis]|uniref:MEDS domain-containing protein n=1 Tax=Bacillus infantis TaxID=324767 RepID=UPI003CEA3434
MKEKITELTLARKDAHIFYSSHQLDHYLSAAADYIVAGIEEGDHIILIENDRIFSLLEEKLKPLLHKEQLGQILHINNFDYYFSSGSFNPPYIFDYLDNILKPYNEHNISFRTWAHVEWREQEGILEILEEFENEADRLVNENSLLLVCAYDAERVPDTLRTALMKCHEFVMTEDSIIPSDLYAKTESA